ncbi:MAG: perosamine synthetase [Clostridiales bacterium]|nr:perosamine synthetase [Clostridiales bacterium]
MIPYGTQWIEEEDIEAVVEVLRSDYLTTGPKVSEFEDCIKEYVGAKYAVAVSNGTAALHVACMAAGISPGDEVITSAITFAASANCVLYCGGTPVFADIEEDTYNISPSSIREKITKRTKAIIPVHFTGQPCDMDQIHAIAKEHNLLVIEDASHALGASYKHRKIGTLSEMTTLSFHPVKHITTGEGGMVLTNDEELYQKLSLLRTHGITREPAWLTKREGGWYYEQQMLGYNYRISDIQCALGISQMKRLPSFLKRRRELAAYYNEAFKYVKGITIPFQKEGYENSWHLYVILVEAERRKEIFDKLREDGIGVNVHYIPVYQHPYYQGNGYQNIHLPAAEKIYSQMISIPMYPKMTRHEQDYVIERIMTHL